MPCTTSELQQPVTVQMVNVQLATRVRIAENAVRRRVRSNQLTQAQFDPLVSSVYHTGAAGARATLEAADRGAFHEVTTHTNSNMYVHPRDAQGRRLAPIRLQGLANRRREEAAPFQGRQVTP
jgi:lysozyme